MFQICLNFQFLNCERKCVIDLHFVWIMNLLRNSRVVIEIELIKSPVGHNERSYMQTLTHLPNYISYQGSHSSPMHFSHNCSKLGNNLQHKKYLAV